MGPRGHQVLPSDHMAQSVVLSSLLATPLPPKASSKVLTSQLSWKGSLSKLKCEGGAAGPVANTGQTRALAAILDS